MRREVRFSVALMVVGVRKNKYERRSRQETENSGGGTPTVKFAFVRATEARVLEATVETLTDTLGSVVDAGCWKRTNATGV